LIGIGADLKALALERTIQQVQTVKLCLTSHTGDFLG